MRHLRLALGLCLLGLLSVALPPAQAQSLGAPGLWSPLRAFTANGGRGFEPELAFDGDGFVHLAFFAGDLPDQWAVFYTSNRPGGGSAFASPRLISQGNGGQERSPDIAVGRDGQIHVIYERRDSDEVFYVGSPDLGATWTRPQGLSGDAGKAYEPAIAVDADSGAHAVWTDRRWTGDQQVTYAYRARGGAWTGPAKVGGNTFDRFPDITTSFSGPELRVQIAYQARVRGSNRNEDFDILLLSGPPGRFGAPQNISADGGTWSLEPAIVSDGASRLFLAWDKQVSGSHDIVFSRSDDGGLSWAEPVNLARRPNLAASPSLAFGRGGGIARLHIGWDEDNLALYLPYEPDTNEFGDQIELVGAEGNAGQVGLAASDRTTLVAFAYQGGGAARVAARVAGFPVRATLSVAGGQAAVSSRALPVSLGDLRGDPTEMRYAFGRAPGDADPWLMLQPSFSVQAPVGPCTQTLFLQLRAPDGRLSPVYERALVVDDQVQAALALGNPYRPGAAPRARETTSLGPIDMGDANYTRDALFYVEVADAGECSGLASFSLEGGTPFSLGPSGFRGVLPLPGPTAEGPRPVTLRVVDALGNTLVLSRNLTLDRTPPGFAVMGTLRIDAPDKGLASPRTTLQLSGTVAADNFYPGGAWGALVANSADPRARDDALDWRPAALIRANGSLSVPVWNLLVGLAAGPGDRALAGRNVEVRLKLVDGAGNVSHETLTTTVRLAQDYQVPGLWVPVVVNG
jgi:hypothetical protein